MANNEPSSAITAAAPGGAALSGAPLAQEFKQHLEQLQEVITSALSFYAVWNKLRLHDGNEVPWSLERQNQILGRWGGFFSPVGIGLQRIAMLEFAKVLDGDTRTVSLTNLLRRAERDSSLVPNARTSELRDIRKRLRKAKGTVATIKKLRDQRLAHADAAPEALPPLMSREMDSLIEDIKFAFNRLSVAHDNSTYSWDSALRGSERHTVALLRLLVDETERREKEYTDKIVEITVGHIRGMETSLGRPLDDEELESVIRQFSPTAEQVELIRRVYALK